MTLLTHIVLFLILSFGICVMGVFYAEPEDGPALRSLPRRYGTFVGACSVVAAILLVVEWAFASVR